MNVLLINGGPHEKGSTFAALSQVAMVLNENDIDTEILWVGRHPIRGCIGCGQCRKTEPRRCVYQDDPVNVVIEKAENADGFVFGSPVHYASASGAITSLLDRCFYAASGTAFAFKPGACVVCARRAGTTAALDQLQKYVTYANMPLISSQYWNMVHGSNSQQAEQDLEGMQTMRVLGRNMAWILKCLEAGRAAGIDVPTLEARITTSFIR